MKKETAVAAIIVFAVAAFVGGYILGGYNPDVTEADRPGHAGGGHYDSNIIPVGESPVLGSPSAKATVVFFVDFTASSAVETAQDIDDILGGGRIDENDVRLVVKVLPDRDDTAVAAATAALFAADHGRFFGGVYEGLRENADSLDRDTIVRVVENAGLDADAFERALNDDTYAGVIEADSALARSLGQRSAPAVFINGRGLGVRELSRDALRERIMGEIASVEERIEAGEPASQMYALRVRENADRQPVAVRERAPRERGAGARADRGQARPQRPEREEPDEGAPVRERPAPTPPEERAAAEPPDDDVERLRVPVTDADYVRGPQDALVTIVEFSDFNCPFCGRVTPTLESIFEEYGEDVRLVFKQNPLPMHPNAPLAARAALAAGEQGKFWEMHDLLFANQRRQSREDMESFAEELGLDMDQFRTDIDRNDFGTVIDQHQTLAQTVGARGTPHFFINGRRLRGAQPLASFQEIIDSELALAHQMMEDGTERASVYDTLMEGAQERAAAAAPSRPAEPEVVEPPPIGDSAVRGPEDAPVTIFVFSEFQCPYCGRAQNTLAQIEENYGDRVRLVFKAFPLPFHENANLASQAALAAGAQGQFWEYHDILFQNQRALSRADLERYAEQLNLDMDRFRADLDSESFADQIAAETAEGRRAGVSGTPTFLINGERLVGAQPFTAFQPVIERHLED